MWEAQDLILWFKHKKWFFNGSWSNHGSSSFCMFLLDCDLTFEEFEKLKELQQFVVDMWNLLEFHPSKIKWKGDTLDLVESLSNCELLLFFSLLFWNVDMSRKIVGITNLYAISFNEDDNNHGGHHWSCLMVVELY